MKAPLRIDWDARERVEVRPGIHASTIRSDGLTVSMYRYAGSAAVVTLNVWLPREGGV